MSAHGHHQHCLFYRKGQEPPWMPLALDPVVFEAEGTIIKSIKLMICNFEILVSKFTYRSFSNSFCLDSRPTFIHAIFKTLIGEIKIIIHFVIVFVFIEIHSIVRISKGYDLPL